MYENMEEYIWEDRIINKFPGPYCLDSTINVQVDFSGNTKIKCAKELQKIVGNKEWLKINKVVIIGDVSVGKTCLVNRYCRKIFESNYKATIGVDFEVVKYEILGIPYILQIWDTAGQERFKSIAQSYYRGASVVVIVFDLRNCHSLSNCKKWLHEALEADIEANPLVFLVGTKRDLLNNFSYKNIKSNAQQLAKSLNAEYWSVSSKSGKNVDKLFRRIAGLSFEQLMAKGFEGRRGAIRIGDKLLGEAGVALFGTQLDLQAVKYNVATSHQL